MRVSQRSPQDADPLPLLLFVAKAGRNHLNDEILPHSSVLGCASDIAINLVHAALLRRCELPLNESAELTLGAL